LRFVGFTSTSPHKGLYGTGSGSPSGMRGLPLSFALHIRTAGVGIRILIFFALDPKLVPKTGNLRFGNSKIRETG
jgi:hypothetical protein